MNQILKSQQTPHGRGMGCLLWENWLHYNITALSIHYEKRHHFLTWHAEFTEPFIAGLDLLEGGHHQHDVVDLGRSLQRVRHLDGIKHPVTVTLHERYGNSNHWHTLFVQQLVQANNKGNIKASHHWPFVRGNHWWLVDSPNKGSVTWRLFPSDDVIMNKNIIRVCSRDKNDIR